MTAVWKVSGLTLSLRVGTLWRRGDGLFFKVSPLASVAIRTTLHPLLENVLQTADHFEIPCLGAPFSWLEKPRNRMGRDLDCMADVLIGFHRSIFSKPNTEFNSDLAPCDFWVFATMKRELRGKKFRSDQRSAARFRGVGEALYELQRLPREILWKRDRHRASTKFRLGVKRWVHELHKRSSLMSRRRRWQNIWWYLFINLWRWILGEWYLTQYDRFLSNSYLFAVPCIIILSLHSTVHLNECR
jgi:hypothetical protein